MELLGKLKEQGFQVGVLSNKPDNVARDIVRTMFGPLVDQAHGQRAEFPTKPDPAAVLQMAADFGVEPGRVLYCGDSGVDMETGRNAGMAPCGVLWGFRARRPVPGRHRPAAVGDCLPAVICRPATQKGLPPEARQSLFPF